MTQQPPIASETPVPQVTSVVKKKPILAIVDDRPDLLVMFAEYFRALGYDVKGVLVLSNQREKDRALFVDGHIKRKLTPDEVVQEAAYQPKGEKPPHFLTMERALAHARFTNEADPDAEENRQYYQDMSQFEFGVVSKSEMKNVLNEIKPDCVLSDYAMRGDDTNISATDWDADDELVSGVDVMRITGQLYPNIPKIIHTGKYAFLKPEQWADERKQAEEAGYILKSKDKDPLDFPPAQTHRLKEVSERVDQELGISRGGLHV